MIVRLLVSNADKDDLSEMVTSLENNFGVDVEITDTYGEDGDEDETEDEE